MRLSRVRGDLHQILSSPAVEHEFQQAREQEAALAEVESLPALMAVLGDATAGFEHQDRLLRAIVGAYQRNPTSRLWSTVLLCAFIPALITIRA
jgi:hypothetical protein